MPGWFPSLLCLTRAKWTRPQQREQQEVPPLEEVLVHGDGWGTWLKADTGICQRHPRACKPVARSALPAIARNWSSSAALIDQEERTADVASSGGPARPALPAAVRALHVMAGSWCLSRDGCIASTWRAETLPQPQRSWLLRSLPSQRGGTAIACFDQSRPSDATIERCPSTLAASESKWAVGRSRQMGNSESVKRLVQLSPVFDGEFGFELLHALPFLQWLHSCGLLLGTSACPGMEPFYTFRRRRPCGTRGWKRVDVYPPFDFVAPHPLLPGNARFY